MRRSAGRPALAAVLAVAVAAVLTSTHASTAAGTQCTIPVGSLQATTAHHLFAVDVGPMEPMYSQSEAKAKHPSSGEIMLGGAMSNVPGPPAPVRHLEVHICSKDGSQVVQNANPVITLADLDSNGGPVSIPVATMEAVGQGVADLHYGNNVLMPADHTYLVTVTTGPDTAAFKLTVGQNGITWGQPTMGAAAALPPTAASPAPEAMGSTGPGTGPGGMSAMSPGGAGAAPPAPATPQGTGAPTPRTGVISDAGPAAGLGAALIGVLLCAVARRRR
jgi:hypothetical protein